MHSYKTTMLLRNVSFDFVSHNRGISTTAVNSSVHNFRKFVLYNRGTEIFRKQEAENPDPDIFHYKSGERPVGYKKGRHFVTIPEQIPEIIVPDLTDFTLKPYVSYKVPNVTQSEFTSQDLFDAVYSKKIAEDYRAGKLDEDGNSLEPSPEELMTREEAFLKSQQTGSDRFDQYLHQPRWKFVRGRGIVTTPN